MHHKGLYRVQRFHVVSLRSSADKLAASVACFGPGFSEAEVLIVGAD